VGLYDLKLTLAKTTSSSNKSSKIKEINKFEKIIPCELLVVISLVSMRNYEEKI